jgi:hypothetical protein
MLALTMASAPEQSMNASSRRSSTTRRALPLRVAQRALQLRSRHDVQGAGYLNPRSVQTNLRAGADESRRQDIRAAGDPISKQRDRRLDLRGW